MPQRKVRFQESELGRAIRAASKSGQRVETIHISREGEVTIHVPPRAQRQQQARAGGCMSADKLNGAARLDAAVRARIAAAGGSREARSRRCFTGGGSL